MIAAVRSAAAAAAAAAAAEVLAPGPGWAGVLGSLVPVGPAGVLAASLEPAFLAEIGWEPSVRVISPPPGHRLLQDAGAGRGYARGGQVPRCAVRGCERRVTAPGRVLCREHRRQQHAGGDLPLEQFLTLPKAVPLPATGPCQVPACPRDRTSSRARCLTAVSAAGRSPGDDAMPALAELAEVPLVTRPA